MTAPVAAPTRAPAAPVVLPVEALAGGPRSEVEGRADFSQLRYAQCWEDADVLVGGLAVRPGDTVLSVASAGDNTLALLAQGAGRVIAADMNPVQLAALALRVAAYQLLAHEELLELVGSRPSARRPALYARCRPALAGSVRAYWDAHPEAIAMGVGAAGKFERYFRLFRRYVLPLVHGRRDVEALLAPKSAAARAAFYDARWDTRRWRWLFRAFFSEWVLGRLGRDPSFFAYVERDVPSHLLARTRHALATLDPSRNPYVQWILTGAHPTALPLALRAEWFEPIREALPRLELVCAPVEGVLAGGRIARVARVDRYNLSNIFEYMGPEQHRAVLAQLLAASAPGTRLACWNLFVPRRGALVFPERLRALDAEAARLFAADQAFFYSAFVLEEVVG
jgi:S-adenosylmethionine-diacylglycerol 3-amino-3-carboxypropyl transferase